MITTGSKFAYALATVLAIAAVAYGYTTGGGGVGPISAGYKGGVGDLFGYTVLLSGAAIASFVGFCLTAFRDADPEAAADVIGADEVPPAPIAPPSYWPVVGAFGATITVVGLVLNNVFFVAGLIALAAVAVEWTMQAWSERATGDPAVNRELRNRFMLPLEAPIGGALAVAVVIGGFSRVFLTVSKEGAVWVALAAAAVIFAAGTVLATRDNVRRDVIAGLLTVGAVVTIGLGIFGAVRGEREFHHLDEGHGAEHGDADDHGEAPAHGEADHDHETDHGGSDDHADEEGH